MPFGAAFETRKNPLEVLIEEDFRVQRSPAVEGVVGGLKGALVAAPIVAAVQALRGKSPAKGAAVAALAAGALTGGMAAVSQKVKNLKTEAALRYHMRNILDREPMVMMPPPDAMTDAGFGQGFDNVYYPY